MCVCVCVCVCNLKKSVCVCVCVCVREREREREWGFSDGSAPPANAGDTGDAGCISGPGRSPGEGNGNPLHCSCLEKSMDRGAWRAAVSGVAKSRT